jgi:uncharacterized membrane protein
MMESDPSVESRIRSSRASRIWFGEVSANLGPHLDRSTLVALTVAALAVLGIVLALVAASRLPDLRLASVRISVNTIAAGGSLEVTDEVKSEGAVPSPPTLTDLCLSRTRMRGDECVPLSGNRSIPSLAPGKESTDRIAVTVPTGTLAGRYYVSDCVDDYSTNTESNLRNNCLSSSSAIVVTDP